jgi:two-component system, sporulation sensor kinase E
MDDLLNMNARVLRPKEEMEQQMEIFRKEAGVSTDLGVVRNIRKDGSMMFVHIIAHDIIFEGRPVRLSLTTDITEKLKVERTLQKSEANLKTIMDTTDTAYALLDKKLNVIAFNQMAVRFVNSQYNHVPVKGDQLADYFPKERLPQFISYADEVLKGKNVSYEINYPQSNGSVFWFYVRLFPITNDKKEIFGLMLALSDVTERKNAEESLKGAYKMVQDHIDSIKDMAWKQSHLIRSPLANLKGLAAMLKEDPADAEVLDYIQNELDRMDAIIVEMAEDASNHDL